MESVPSMHTMFIIESSIYVRLDLKIGFGCWCWQVSSDGKQFVTTSPDRRIRVFWVATGKLRRTYDESLEVFAS